MVSFAIQGCSEPWYPQSLTPAAARAAGFRGPVCHSFEFRAHIDEILAAVEPKTGIAVVVGGGKSAQEYVVSDSVILQWETYS